MNIEKQSGKDHSPAWINAWLQLKMELDVLSLVDDAMNPMSLKSRLYSSRYTLSPLSRRSRSKSRGRLGSRSPIIIFPSSLCLIGLVT